MNAVTKHEAQAQLVPAVDAPMVAMIERIAMDPSVPIERLEKMLDMKERMEDRAREDQERQAKKAYFAAMAECQSEIPVVIKRRANDHTRSKYADLAAIEATAMPVIHRHGFSVSFQPDGYNDKGELRIVWEIGHAEGYVRNGVGEIPVDGAGAQGKVNKTGTQAFGSTATYGRRYLLCMLFNISTGDDTDGNAAPKPSAFITADQFQEIKDLLEKAGREEAGLLKWLKLEYLGDLPQARFGEVMAMLGKAYAEKIAADKEAAK